MANSRPDPFLDMVRILDNQIARKDERIAALEAQLAQANRRVAELEALLHSGEQAANGAASLASVSSPVPEAVKSESVTETRPLTPQEAKPAHAVVFDVGPQIQGIAQTVMAAAAERTAQDDREEEVTRRLKHSPLMARTKPLGVSESPPSQEEEHEITARFNRKELLAAAEALRALESPAPAEPEAPPTMRLDNESEAETQPLTEPLPALSEQPPSDGDCESLPDRPHPTPNAERPLAESPRRRLSPVAMTGLWVLLLAILFLLGAFVITPLVHRARSASHAERAGPSVLLPSPDSPPPAAEIPSSDPPGQTLPLSAEVQPDIHLSPSIPTRSQMQSPPPRPRRSHRVPAAPKRVTERRKERPRRLLPDRSPLLAAPIQHPDAVDSHILSAPAASEANRPAVSGSASKPVGSPQDGSPNRKPLFLH